MNKRPYTLACLLALVSIVGIVGQIIVDGIANTLFLLIAAAPLFALLIAGWARR